MTYIRVTYPCGMEIVVEGWFVVATYKGDTPCPIHKEKCSGKFK